MAQFPRTITRRLPLFLVIVLIGGFSPLLAQRPLPKVKLSAVLTAFLADSGVRTSGLPWTTGSDLPIRWQTPQPVTNPDPTSRQKGITLWRQGYFRGTLGDTVTLGMSISLTGSAAGLSGMAIGLDSMEVTYGNGSGFFVNREVIEESLKNDGLTLQPLKCSRAIEGASYGNLVDALKAPGKTASGLWWYWQSPQQQFSVLLTLLYRRGDMDQVECYSG